MIVDTLCAASFKEEAGDCMFGETVLDQNSGLLRVFSYVNIYI